MNAVYLEMVKLGKKWRQEIKNDPDAISYILLGQKVENQLFETYFKYQLSDESNTDDTYLIYYQPFEDEKSYTNALVTEIEATYKDWQKEEKELSDWHIEKDGNGADYYIGSLINLTQLYPTLQENKMFIHLAPTSISDRKAFECWITNCGAVIERNNAGSYLKLVFTDHEQYRTIANYYKPHYWKYAVDISNLMEKTAESTNKNKGAKENNFQLLILKAGNALSRQKFSDADILLTQAVQLSIKNKFTQGTVLAKLVKAQSKMAQSKPDEAEALYLEALQEAGDNSDLVVQVYFSYGSFLMSRKEKKKAMDVFEKLISIGEEKGDMVLQIESNRLIGQLLDTAILSKSSIPYFERCIALCEGMSPELRKETSTPYIATLLIKKYGKGSNNAIVIKDKMVAFFGENWEQLAKVPDLKKYKKVDHGRA
jgi:tetratricopeptide (TPR) repeat protein